MSSDRIRARRLELDPDGDLTRADWWAVTWLPKKWLDVYIARVSRKQGEAGL
jgi:hypothetical protein